MPIVVENTCLNNSYKKTDENGTLDPTLLLWGPRVLMMFAAIHTYKEPPSFVEVF